MEIALYSYCIERFNSTVVIKVAYCALLSDFCHLIVHIQTAIFIKFN
jgi:hypothetical protein